MFKFSIYFHAADQQEEIGALYDTLEDQKGEILRLHDALGRLTGGPQGKDYCHVDTAIVLQCKLNSTLIAALLFIP